MKSPYRISRALKPSAKTKKLERFIAILVGRYPSLTKRIAVVIFIILSLLILLGTLLDVLGATILLLKVLSPSNPSTHILIILVTSFIYLGNRFIIERFCDCTGNFFKQLEKISS